MFSVKKAITFLHKNRKYICLVLFIAYCIFIVYYTLLCREAGTKHKANLHFMWAYREMLKRYPEWRQDVGYNLKNILFFMPFGFLFPETPKRFSFFGKRQWLTILTEGILFSVFIEVMQYITCRGLCELDDVLCNGLGALIGFWICLTFRKVQTFIHKFEK